MGLLGTIATNLLAQYTYKTTPKIGGGGNGIAQHVEFGGAQRVGIRFALQQGAVEMGH